MKPLVLLAVNFLRQHRWPVLLLFAWIVFMALATADFGRSRPIPADIVFYAQQQAIYICIFSAFLAANAIHAERKSRRILLLLSRAVSRAQYVSAIVSATWTLAIGCAVVFALCAEWLAADAGLPSPGLWLLVMPVAAGALVAAAASMFFSTFCNPYLAIAFTLALFCTPAVWHLDRHAWSTWLPGFPLLLQFLKFRFAPDWAPNWIAIIAALLQSVVFWGLAVAAFERRDIAVPVE
ncbi:MAG TPA: hypothetical protein VL240_08440 [Candidatus Binatia bacterium]|nr:hypothetical protein [Candidatus Binatia bacterium]